MKPLLKHIDRPELIQKWKQNLDAAAYEKHIKKRNKATIKEEINWSSL